MPDVEEREKKHLSIEEHEINSCLNCWKGVQVMRDYGKICELAERDEEIMGMLNVRKSKFGVEADLEKNIQELSIFFGIEGNAGEKRRKLEPFIKGRKTWEVREAVICRLLKEQQGGEIVEKLSGLLGIRGSLEEKYEVLRGLSSMGEYGDTDFRAGDFIEEKSAICLANLPSILMEIKDFYDENEVEMETKKYNSHRKHIFSTMHEINMKYADKNKYDTGKCEKSLKLFEKRLRQDDVEKRRKFREGLLHIFETFCDNCGRDEFDINKGRMCEAETFLRVMRDSGLEDGVKERGEFNRRLALLSDRSKKIMDRYMQNAPKKFGSTLRIVMREQGIDKDELARIVNPCVEGQDIRGRTIEAYMNADMPQKYTWESVVPYLCRALLISEDVLYKGHGKSYGFWSGLLDDGGGLEEIGRLTGIKDEKGRKNIFHEGIAKFVGMGDVEFREWVRKYPDILREEDYDVYSGHGCFDNLLHKEHAYILLDVLERMDKEDT